MNDGKDNSYCYPNSNVLKNHFNVKEIDKLNDIKECLTSINIAEIYLTNCVKGNLDFEHLKAIHKFIFKEIYPFAGQVRSINISKWDTFCLCQNICYFSEDIFKNLYKDNYLMGLFKEKFTVKAAEYMGDINALHPFREGNGRSQRAFIRMLGKVAGYDIDFSNVSKDFMIDASIKSFRGDNFLYEKMFNEITKPIR